MDLSFLGDTLWKQILMHTPVNILTISQDGIIQYANGDIFGTDCSDLSGKSLLDFFVGEDRRKIENNIRKVLEDGKVRRFTVTGPNELEIDMGLSLIKTDTPCIVCEFHESPEEIGKDASRQKGGVPSLLGFKTFEEMFQTIAEQSLLGIRVIREGRVVYANRAYADIIGRTLDETYSLKEDELWELIHPDDREPIRQRREEYDRAGQTQTSNIFRIVRPDGEVRWVEGNVTFHELEGESSMLRTVVDVTDKVLAEQALREERDRMRMYLDLARVIFVALDREGSIVFINKKGTELFGYHRDDEIIGRSWFDFTPEDAREEVVHNFRRMIDGEIEFIEGLER